MNHFVEQLKNIMLANLQTAIDDRQDDILKDIEKLSSDNKDDPGKPLKFSVSFGAVLDLDRNRVKTKLSWASRTVIEREDELEDPKQTKLPFAGAIED
jgi:hypothetical protein